MMNTGNSGRAFLAAYLLTLIRIKDLTETEQEKELEAFAEDWLQRESIPVNPTYADFTSKRNRYSNRYHW